MIQTKTVGDLVTEGVLAKPIDGNHGSIHPKSGDFLKKGVPFIMASDLDSRRIIYENCVFISPKKRSSLRKGFAKPGDVLLTHKATIGQTALVDNQYDELVLTPQVTYYRVLNQKVMNNEYLLYYFRSKPFQDLLKSWASDGSTRAYLGITAQIKLPIALPSIDQQNFIAKTLGAIDEKIELNRKMNETLEEMGQALFNHHFVDNPEAKKWSMYKISDIAKVQYGYAFKSSNFNENARGMKITRIRNIIDGDTASYTTETAANDFLIDDGDLLVGMDGDFHINYWSGGKAYLVQRVACFRAKKGYANSFVKYVIEGPIRTLNRRVARTTVAHLGAKDINGIIFPFNVGLYSELATDFSSLFEQQKILMVENRTLASLRDFLLPRLIDGRINL